MMDNGQAIVAFTRVLSSASRFDRLLCVVAPSRLRTVWGSLDNIFEYDN
jgi:hypothetical protein